MTGDVAGAGGAAKDLSAWMGNCTNDSACTLRSSRATVLGELASEDARTQQRSMLALIPLASATDAIDAWGSRANATTRALNSSECLRQLRLCGLPVAGKVGVVYMCPSKVCGHKHPRSATPVQGEIAGRIRCAYTQPKHNALLSFRFGSTQTAFVPSLRSYPYVP